MKGTSRTADNASLATEAYLEVRQRILRGNLVIGQHISRRRLATELGMSFLPVSEALQRLEFEGLVESRPRAGTRVKIPSRQDVRGHYVIREALECQAARLFARAATAEEKAELSKLAARVDTLSVQADGNRVTYLVLHEKLHRRIAECARCPALSDAIEKTRALSSTWLCSTSPAAHQGSPARHQELVRMLSAGDPAASVEAMREHVNRSMQNTLRRLEPFFRMRKTRGQSYSRAAKTRGSVPDAAD